MTSHREQIRFASRVEPPFSGKNASGSVCEHNARSCHSGAFPSRSATSSWPSIKCLLVARRRHRRCNPPRERRACPSGPVLLRSVRTTPFKLHACNACAVKPNLIMESPSRHPRAATRAVQPRNLPYRFRPRPSNALSGELPDFSAVALLRLVVERTAPETSTPKLILVGDRLTRCGADCPSSCGTALAPRPHCGRGAVVKPLRRGQPAAPKPLLRPGKLGYPSTMDRNRAGGRTVVPPDGINSARQIGIDRTVERAVPHPALAHRRVDPPVVVATDLDLPAVQIRTRVDDQGTGVAAQIEDDCSRSPTARTRARASARPAPIRYAAETGC